MKEIKLDLKAEKHVQDQFKHFLSRIKRDQRKSRVATEAIQKEREQLRISNSDASSNDELLLLYAKSLILDLLQQDWFLKIRKGSFFLAHTAKEEEQKLAAQKLKEKVRNSHLISRNSQFLVPSVAEFIERMERRKFTEKGWVSIFSLMRDGEELERSLSSISAQEKSDFEGVIDPYIQFVETGKKCQHTDLYLTDIWRYFRYTWITTYKSLPGRSISILIRDAAAEHHPVIGIAALGSSMAQLTKRDRWIGWEADKFLENLREDPNKQTLDWILKIWNDFLQELYIDDLLREKNLSLEELEAPDQNLITYLRERAEEEKEGHRRFPHEAKKSKEGETINWNKRAETALFKSKRYSFLADLLSIKLILDKYEIHRGLEHFVRALDSAEFRDAIGKLVRRRKGQRVGIDIMDIIICGSIAPYNHLIGGKLVSLMLTSPEVVNYYNSKYSRKESLIASAMAGKPIVRKPKLTFLATTSLYGVASSQYNRLKMPMDSFGGSKEERIEYINLGISEGFGSFQFSQETLEWGHQYLGRRIGGRRVNSIFGEGANPLMRKIREALELIGLESEPILKHGKNRIIYGIPLAKNVREVLLGFDQKPDYIIPTELEDKEATKRIVKFWEGRWLEKRIQKKEILENIKEHSKAYPITHGARAPLYKIKAEDEGLFPSYQ